LKKNLKAVNNFEFNDMFKFNKKVCFKEPKAAKHEHDQHNPPHSHFLKTPMVTTVTGRRGTVNFAGKQSQSYTYYDTSSESSSGMSWEEKSMRSPLLDKKELELAIRFSPSRLNQNKLEFNLSEPSSSDEENDLSMFLNNK